MVSCFNDRSLTHLECALKSTQAFIENTRREADNVARETELRRIQNYEKQRTDNQQYKIVVLIVFFVFALLALITYFACKSFSEEKRQRERDSTRIFRERLCGIESHQARRDHVSFYGVDESQRRPSDRNSSVPVNQFIRPSAPIQAINNPTPIVTSNLSEINVSIITRHGEQIDLPPTYAECIKQEQL